MSELKIKSNKEKIVKLLNENIDLGYKLEVKRMKKTFDKELNFGTKKKPEMVNVTFGVWIEIFKDQDLPNDKPMKMERSQPIAVNGEPCDAFYRLLKHQYH